METENQEENNQMLELSYQYAVSEWLLAMRVLPDEEMPEKIREILDKDAKNRGKILFDLSKTAFLQCVRGDKTNERFVEAWNRFAMAQNGFNKGFLACERVSGNQEPEKEDADINL